MQFNHLIKRFKLSPILASSALLAVLTGCGYGQLPPCVEGKEAPTLQQKALWKSVENVTSIDLGIDGSGSMLGFTGSAVTLNSWRSLIQGVNTASVEQDLTVNAQRIGGGYLQPFDDPLKATNPCFFSGCGEFQDVTSSLHSLWNAPGLTNKKVPLRVLISDLEVDNQDISTVIKAIKPHTKVGAVIGVLAMRLPFNGKVYGSDGSSVLYKGEAQRPIYILASGPQAQVRPLLISIKNMMKGVPNSSKKLTFLEEWVNRKTLTAKSLVGTPPGKIFPGQPISLGKDTYFGTSDYRFTKFTKGLNGLILGSNNSYLPMTNQPAIGIEVKLKTIPLNYDQPLDGFSAEEVKIKGSILQVKLNAANVTDGMALRVEIPRGQLPEDWWIEWDRTSTESDVPQDQTEGLFDLMRILGLQFAAQDTTPASSFCILTNLETSSS